MQIRKRFSVFGNAENCFLWIFKGKHLVALVARGGFYSFGQMAMRSARARGREGCFESPLPTSGLHSPRNELRASRP